MHLTAWLPLLLIPPAVALVVWLGRRKDWFPARKRRVIVTSALAAALLLVALCHPTFEMPWGQVPTVIFMADASPSMRFAQPWDEAAQWVRRELPPSVQFGVVAFSDSAQVAVAPGRSLATPGRSLAALPPGQASQPTVPRTNIEQAIRSAAALSPDPARAALLLYSDGRQTEGDAAAAAAQAAARGLRLFCLAPARPPAPPNAAILDAECPAQLAPGETGTVRAAVRANRDGRARLVLVDLSAETPTALAESLIDLQADAVQRAEFPIHFPAPDRRTLELRLANFPDDAVPEDDRWTLALLVGDRRPLLEVYYEPETGREKSLPLVLPAGQSVARVEAAALPTETARLADYAAVILHDVPAYALPAQSLAALGQYVRDLGGGLVAVAGENSFGLGGYSTVTAADRGSLDDLLPVRSDPQDRPPVCVVLVLDRSGSMNELSGGLQKLALAKEAALELSALLDQRDRASLVIFNHEHSILVENADTAHWQRLRAALAPVPAEGGTRLGPALSAALDLLAHDAARLPAHDAVEASGPARQVRASGLARTPAETPDGKPVRRQVIAVTDGLVVGQDQQAPFDPAEMAARARAAKITVSIVLTGTGPACWSGLRELAAASGGRFYDVSAGLLTESGRNRLARIFLEDLELPVLERSPRELVLRDRAPLWPAAAEARFPAVPEHIFTEAKERAAVHLETVPPAGGGSASAGAVERPRPILATWPCGLGRAVAWTAPWQTENAAWLRDGAVSAAFQSAVLWAARGPIAEADYDVEISAPGGRLAATVSRRQLRTGLARLPALSLVLSGAHGTAQAADAAQTGSTPARFALDPTGPGTWTLTATIPAGAYGYALEAGLPAGLSGGLSAVALAKAEALAKPEGPAQAGEESARQLIRRGTLSTGPAAEFRHLDNDEAFLGRLAALGGGRLLASPAQALELARLGAQQIALWPYLIALAALAVLYEALRSLLARGR